MPAAGPGCVIIGPAMREGPRRGGREEVRGLFYVVVSTVGYGLLPILAKLAYAAGVRTPGLLAWRFLGAWLLFFLLARGAPALALAVRLRLWGLGAIFVVNTLTYFGALETVPASTVALLLYTYPVIVTLLSAALGMERLTLRGLGAAALAVSGCALTADAAAAASPRGVALALMTALIYASYVVLGSRLAAGIPSQTVALHVTQVAAVAYLPWAVLGGDLLLPATAVAWGTVAALCLFCTVVPIRAFLAGLERIGPARAAVVSSLEVVVTIGLATAFLHERIGFRSLLGGALILGGVLVQNLGVLRRMDGPPSPASGPDAPAV
jgi:drug/metabolite transporter (DMT)-like permease